jgi:hypothetical protein
VLEVIPMDEVEGDGVAVVDAVGVEGCCEFAEEMEEGFCNELLAPVVEPPFDATVVNNALEMLGLFLEAEVLPDRERLLPPNRSELI